MNTININMNSIIKLTLFRTEGESEIFSYQFSSVIFPKARFSLQDSKKKSKEVEKMY